jgi:hypothetical protein
VLAWNHPQPGSKSTPLFEGCSVADRSDRGSGNYRADSRNRDQSSAGFKFAGDALNQLVGFVNLSVQLLHFQP